MQQIEMMESQQPEVAGQPPAPRSFRWQGRTFTVSAVLRRWQDHPSRARGALKGRQVPFGAATETGARTYFRVRTEDGSVFDLAYDPQASTWGLLRQLASGAGGR
ncbi:MAG: hypothetical protein IMX02_12825 [Limnochordaceae bacterium]|uniref:DUF6504 family protein n=1 Tax=Carboxydichorda subterranea TaxID=3109565 RepID=A0ABZ1BWP5_9FIRM|nr:DUF6504 family protein [Limnochorda sp. L945t]MBE3599619.1 hypothetical protein [Limnochordaceae bacterium]WRP17093.1 DUF6504 family protein [Limnochorda sp. L945t]